MDGAGQAASVCTSGVSASACVACVCTGGTCVCGVVGGIVGGVLVLVKDALDLGLDLFHCSSHVE